MDRIAFVFAGQGAQYVGMGRSLYEDSKAARAIFDQAEALCPGTLSLCFDGPKEALTVTRNTQPCLMAMDCACAAALIEQGVKPQGLAGFSLGEIAALPFAGLLSFEDAFRLVMKRAELMQTCAEACPGGMIAVLKLADADIERLCEQNGAWPVNFNCPGQVVCAMPKERMAIFTDAVKQAGGRAMPLAVSGGFHSPFMHNAAIGLREYAQALNFAEPMMPLYADRTCLPYTAHEAAALLGAQVENPVRWTELIRQMQADGFTRFIEVGAGKTLTGLIRKIDTSAWTARVEDAETLTETRQMCKEANLC